jgi:uncharacterized RDD family membrane protein YckC
MRTDGNTLTNALLSIVAVPALIVLTAIILAFGLVNEWILVPLFPKRFQSVHDANRTHSRTP